jgi:hypothetical protein
MKFHPILYIWRLIWIKLDKGDVCRNYWVNASNILWGSLEAGVGVAIFVGGGVAHRLQFFANIHLCTLLL